MSVPLAATDPQGGRLSATGKLRLSAEILTTYCRVRWWLARKDLPEVVETIRSRERLAEETVTPWNGLRLGAAVVRLLSLLPTDSRCLMRSLVLLTLLERRSVTATLVIGVKPAPSFGAHAWVERDGRPLLPAGDEFGRLVAI